jgi:hypothetical protein
MNYLRELHYIRRGNRAIRYDVLLYWKKQWNTIDVEQLWMSAPIDAMNINENFAASNAFWGLENAEYVKET